MDSLETQFEAILKNVQSYLPDPDLSILKKAYDFSLRAHREQLRAGGDPFIIHPLAVAKILSDLQLDVPTLAAGLLHDVLEDTNTSRETLCSEFGAEIASLVEGVTKIDSLEQVAWDPENLSFLSSSPEILKQAEYWRKMLLATAQDIRVILLKLADRKHNMQTLEFLTPEKRKKIAEETLTLYAPLANRLGMFKLKSSLEDLSLKYLDEQVYAALEKKIDEREVLREGFIRECVEKIQAALADQPIPYKISARPKNLYSVYRKMLRQGKPFEEIQDIIGIRLITDTIEHCYALLGAVQTSFTPVPDSFTDYIATPKNNLYQSLHITIQISRQEIVEVQIRTEEMNQICEYGVAAHWRYKEGGKSPAKKQQDSLEDKLDWIKQILEWQQDTKNPKEFLEWLKLELEFDQVFVFTPKGEVKKLPAGATPIDFAYAVHTDLGHQCIGSKVNGKMVRLDHPLKSGDMCQILTKKGQKPHKDWLEIVKTPRARSKIRKFLRENEEKGTRYRS
ncbi:MAG: bifunctional (p)ppGpp synthetase/guanosine-3',5'-bis(diphosphate) 3'-pyrophosphohydrolase [Elusimicrobia bacterium]|nr:bifunctional (p)ppGpp synthetase/guanosine-3',5'-bis(diphosphate) 3'-pyrophosphohydrolase [Elusimicrobiota bacterium]